VSRVERTLDRVLRGTADANVAFADLCALLRYLGFDERIRGSHHIFTRSDVLEILNLQPRGSQAKPYQVKQVRGVVLSYRLGDSGTPGRETVDDDTSEGTSPEGHDAG
jgi:hypothetical protein